MDDIGDLELSEEIAWLRQSRSQCEEVDREIWMSLGAALAEQFARTNEERYLHEMAEVCREAVDRLPEADPARVVALDQLVACSQVRLARAQSGPARNHLVDETFRWLDTAAPDLALLDRDHLAQRWYDLAVVSGLADDEPDAEGLRWSITALRRVLDILAPDDLRRREVLHDLGLALVDRHDLVGDPLDLDATIEVYTQLCRGPEPVDDEARGERGELLYALAFVLNRRAGAGDRREAVGRTRKAVDILPRGREEWYAAVEQLAMLCTTHGLAVLGPEEPTLIWQDNAGTPTPTVVSEEAAREVADAVAHCREVLHAAGPALNLVARGHLLTALGVLLGHRAVTTAAVAGDLEEALGFLREVRDTLPPDHELCGIAAQQGGELALHRARSTGDQAQLDEAAGLLVGALEFSGGDPVVAVDVACNLAMVIAEAVARGLRPEWYAHVVALVEDATAAFADAPSDVPDDVVPALRGVLGAAYAWQAGASEDGALAVRAIALCEQVVREVPVGHHARSNAEAGLAVALMNRFQLRGDLRDVAAAIARIRLLIEELPDEPVIRAPMVGCLGIALAMHATATEHVEESQEAIGHLQHCVHHLPEGHPVAPAATAALGALLHVRAARSALDSGSAPTTWAGVREVLHAVHTAPVTSVVGMDARARLAAVLAEQGVVLAQRDQRTGAWFLRQAADLLRAVVTADHTHGPRISVIGSLGVIQLALAQHTGDRSQLGDAIRHLEAAERAMVDGPGHSVHAEMVMTLGRAHRLYGRDSAAGRAAGMRAMLGFAWQVLIQVGTDDALATARGAAEHAVEVAAWCLEDGAVDEAVAALEGGRALVLHAVTATADIPDLLRAAGHEALASEWENTPYERAQTEGGVVAAVSSAATPSTVRVPDDLRHRVLQILGGVDGLWSASSPLLDAPSVGELSRALCEVGADALVYLVPRSQHIGGTAVVVHARGDTDVIRLPALEVGTDTPVDSYARELAARLHDTSQHDEEREAVSRRWQEALGTLCEWAWHAVLGPLVDRMEALAPESVPRLVLVPAGPLGLVPWHAARRRDGAHGWRYAVQDAAVSVAASGRLLCEVSKRQPTPHDGRAVIVGDPTGDLPAAAAEAWALLRTHYRRGAYLGTAAAQTREDSSHPPPGTTPTTPVGRGTPEEVLARLPGGALDDGPPVYHLACHGQVATSPSASRLTLADGRRLTVDDILSQARRPRRPAGGPVVTLAACTSSLTEREHDEALTFATAFLVAGAATAVGALWQVSDRFTSTFMLALHHFIATRRPGDGYGDAVRRAQLWMLDPARVPLAGMSEDVHGRDTWGNLTHPVAWAGFVHAGR